jgi:O-antigen ligase
VHRSLELLQRLVLVLVGVTLPFEHFAISSTVVFLTPNKLVTALLLVFVALQWAVERRRPPHDPKRLWVLFFLVVLVISALQSILYGVSPDPVRRDLTTWYSLALFYFMMIYTLRTRRDLDVLLGAFTVGAVAAVFSGWAGWGETVETTKFGERLSGEGGGPNLLAFNLLIALAGTASLYFTTRSRGRRFLYLATLAIIPLGVVATLSRSGIIALTAMGGFWIVRFRRFGFLRYAAPILALLVLAALLAPENVVKRLGTLTPQGIQEEQSAHGRLTMWYGAARAFTSNPITGVGLGGYKTFAGEEGLRGTGLHSAYLQVLAEQGLVGFIPWLAILILAWSELASAWVGARRRRARGDPELKVLAFRAGLLQIGFFGVLVMSLAQPSMRHKGLWLLFALATTLRALVRSRIEALEPTQEPVLGSWAAPTLLPPPLSTSLDANAR